MQDKEPDILKQTKRIVSNNSVYVFEFFFLIGILLSYVKRINVSDRRIFLELGISLVFIIYSSVCSSMVSTKKYLYDDSALNSGRITQKPLFLMNVALFTLWLTSLICVFLCRNIRLQILLFTGIAFELLLLIQIYIFSKVRFSVSMIVACIVLISEIVLMVMHANNISSIILDTALCISAIWAITSAVIVKSV